MRKALGIIVVGLTAMAVACGGPSRDPIVVEADTSLPGTLIDWVDQCGTGAYPCPPYGDQKFDVLQNTILVPGNQYARELALEDPDGLLSLATYHNAGKARGLFVFISTHW